MKSKSLIVVLLFLSFLNLPAQNTDKKNEKLNTVFEPSWESLKQYDCPEWFRDAKFGIWAHWGPQSVAEYGDWFARSMYIQGNTTWYEGKEPTYTYHLKKYGHPSEFGYKDLIPLFTAEKWDPEALMELYYKAGARYFMSMGQHHDNFDMWNSKFQPWNAVNMGPKKDIVKDWQKAAKNNNMRFGVSMHGEFAWQFFEVTRMSDTTGTKKGIPYDGVLTKADGTGKWWEGYDPQDLYCRPHKPSKPFYELCCPDNSGDPPDSAFLTKFYNRITDLVDNYHPDLIYFDGDLPQGDYGLRFASHFYNENQKWNNGKNEAVINTKRQPADRQKAVVLDIENGQSDFLKKYPWQTDASLDGWFYMKGGWHASTKDIIEKLIDIVSKNGNLMLNITQKSDGTIQEYAVQFLKEMGQWMDINGEAIHGTRPWEVFGEGPHNTENGEQNKSVNIPFTSEDIRFTTKGNKLYAFIMAWPGKNITIKSLPTGKKLWYGEIKEIKMLGYDAPLKWSQDANGLTVQLPDKPPCNYAFVIKITGK